MKLHVEDNNTPHLSVTDSDSVGIKAGDAVNISASSYTKLTDKPTLEGVELDGSMTLDDVNAYTQTEVDTLLSAKANTEDLAEVATSGSYNDLEDKPSIPVVPTNVSAFNNDAGYLTGYTETDPTVPSWAKAPAKPTYTAGEVGALPDSTHIPSKVSELSNDSGYITTETDPTVPAWAKASSKPSYTASEVGALPDTTSIPSKVSDLDNDSNFTTKTYVDEADDDIRGRVFYGIVDGTSTNTAFTATIPGITEYVDGLAVMLKNGVVTSAAGFTIDINGLGAKQAYSNMAAATAESTMFNVNYTMLFIYDSTRVAGGGWILYRGYNANDNTIGYQVRTNAYSLPATDAFVRYRLLFTSPDHAHFVPANKSTSTSATAKKDVITTAINPFGPIVYYSTTTAISAGSMPGVGALWQQYAGIVLGYSFNRTGVALTLTAWKPVFVKCTPQADASAIIDANTPFVQDLPTTNDGKIYILLGVATEATKFELNLSHPVYYHDGTSIRLWTGPTS